MLPGDVDSDTFFFKTLDDLNNDPEVHGILMFRPLPKHLDGEKARKMLNPAKDVDGCRSRVIDRSDPFYIFGGNRCFRRPPSHPVRNFYHTLSDNCLIQKGAKLHAGPYCLQRLANR